MLKHIKLGIKEVFYYNYEGDPLPIRPISSQEMDQAIYNALVFSDPKVAELAVKLKLGIFDGTKNIKYDSKSYAKLKKYYDSIDYWIVYYGMKDFQDEEFSKPDMKEMSPIGFLEVKKMNHVHDIANMIRDRSYQPKEAVKEVVKTEDGKILAKIVFYLNQPLCESFGDMTKLQRDFLAYSKAKEPGKVRQSTISKTGDIVKLQKLVKNVDSD